jgi:hypothetical protein
MCIENAEIQQPNDTQSEIGIRLAAEGVDILPSSSETHIEKPTRASLTRKPKMQEYKIIRYV